MIAKTVLIVMFTFSSAAYSEYNFPIDSFIQKRVWFWEMVFDKFDSQNVIIHDVDHPEIIVDVLNFRKIAKRVHKRINYKEKKRWSNKYLLRYQTALKRFANNGLKARKLGKMEQRIYNVYSQKPDYLSDMIAGKSKLRLQTGLADSFATALKRAEKYLPYMERIFTRAGLPRELTRLPFVESMFNGKALSKVGAFGMWQFMPATAKSFMTVNKFIDERKSPLKSTQAAARLMASNYKILKSWPLAVTAYNHGAGGLHKAKKTLKTKKLSTIIQHHTGRNFGFASKNFYAEFIAANRIFNKHYHPSRYSQFNPLEIEAINVGQKFSLSDIIKHTPLSKQTISKYNSCILTAGQDYYMHKKLPKNYVMFIPKNSSKTVRHALDRLLLSKQSTTGKAYAKN